MLLGCLIHQLITSIEAQVGLAHGRSGLIVEPLLLELAADLRDDLRPPQH